MFEMCWLVEDFHLLTQVEEFGFAIVSSFRLLLVLVKDQKLGRLVVLMKL